MPTRLIFATVVCFFVVVNLDTLCSAQAPSAPTVKDPFGGNPFARGNMRAPFSQPPPGKATTTPAKPVPRKTGSTKPAIAQSALDESPAETRIRKALDSKTTQAFADTPLNDALRQLSNSHDIPIVVDRRALEEIGLTIDTPVTINLRDVSLRSFLRLMLRELDLSFIVKDEVMQITTTEVASKFVVVKMHMIPSSLTHNSDKIIKAIQGTVLPAEWDTVGGTASAHAVENVLAVSGTSYLHEQVASFLVKLNVAYEKHRELKK